MIYKENTMAVLVFGLGSMGRRRIRLLKQYDPTLLIIGIDTSFERQKKCSEIFKIQTYSSFESVKNLHEVYCAFVCTPPLSHKSIISQCLKNGWHVFSELNLVDDGYIDNIQQARDKDLTLFLSSTFLYREEVQFIKSKVAENVTKSNYVYHVGQYLPDWHPWEHYSQFFVGDKRTNGCREIMAIELPWLVETFGQVVDLDVRKDTMSSLSLPYPDNYAIMMVHESGTKGLIAIDVISRKAVRNFELFGENLYLSWNGTPQGLIWYDIEEKKEKQIVVYDKVDNQENYSRTIIENAYYQEIVSFFSIAAGNERPMYSFEKDMQIIELMNRIEG